jgi:tetratricopeptide (TPR) repeat protein
MNSSSMRIVILNVLVAVASSCSSGSNVSGQRNDMENELSAGARAFQAREFDKSRLHFQKALDLDPKSPKAAILLARVLGSQYHRDDATPENLARANEALAAYQRVLTLDPNNDEAAGAVFAFLDILGKDDVEVKLAEERAANPAVTTERRAEAYILLASKQWDCSFTVTEMGGNKQLVERNDGAVVVQYRKPKDPSDYDRAAQCVARGLELAEKAIALNPKSDMAWAYKTNLLLEARKLAQMEGKPEQQAEMARQADEAQQRAQELSARKRQEEPPAKQLTTETGFDSLVPPVDYITTLVAPVEPEPAVKP